MTPVILAGGKGTRLAACVSDRPKVLAPVKGRPFLSFLLDQLVSAGFRDAILCVGYRADQVEAAIGTRHGDMAIRYSRETVPLGTGGAVRQALGQVATASVLLMNGDSFVGLDLSAYVAWCAGRGCEASLVLVEVPDTGRYGRVTVDTAGRVTAFAEKGQAGPGWINGGIYQLSRSALQTVLPPGVSSLEREGLPGLVKRGLLAYPCKARFIDIGTPASYAEADSVLP